MSTQIVELLETKRVVSGVLVSMIEKNTYSREKAVIKSAKLLEKSLKIDDDTAKALVEIELIHLQNGLLSKGVV